MWAAISQKWDSRFERARLICFCNRMFVSHSADVAWPSNSFSHNVSGNYGPKEWFQNPLPDRQEPVAGLGRHQEGKKG